MATFTLVRLTPKFISRRIFSRQRSLKNLVCTFFLNNFHTSKIILKDDPLKYTTSEASQMCYPDFKKNDSKELWYKNYVILATIFIFLLYFLYFREENDIDEMLAFDSKNQNNINTLVSLHMELIYRKQNNLPTYELENKIESLKKELNIKSY